MPPRDRGPTTPRSNLLSYVDDLRRFGGRPAYMWKDGVRWRSRSYSALHSRILACAGTLARSGVGPGEPVLIQGPDAPDWVEALLGTYRVGGVAVPLEASTQEEFRAKVARACGSRILVAPPSIGAPPGCRRIALGSWPDAPRDEPPRAAPGPADRAEIVFTSGSTGEPKGVILTHGNLVSDFAPIEDFLRGWERRIRRLGGFRFVSTLPLSHMFGQAVSIFLPTFLGLTVIFTRPRPSEVKEAARRHGAWGLFTVPRLLELLGEEVRRDLREAGALEALDRRRRRLEGWPFPLQALACWRVQRLFGWRFRLIVAGGASLREAVQQFWLGCGYLVMQGYGLTETAPIVSLSRLLDRRAGQVGRPLLGQEVRLGPDGEILVRGPNVTPGYLGQEGRAAEKAWFHTGDVGEIDAQGRLRIRGRLKDVIVTSEGENVHAEDVERAFEGIPGVREACVIGLPLEGGDRVHAVLLLDEGADPGEAVLAANRRLAPKQRVRGHTVWPDDDLPRTSTGKLRKGRVIERVLALRRDASRRGEAAGAAAPGDLRRLVAEVAKVPAADVAETAPLVDGLGLSSLDLVELTVAVEDRFGVSLPEDRLAAATVGELERIVRTAAARGVRVAAAGPAPDGSRTAAAPVEAGSRPAADRAGGERAGPRARRGALRMPRWARRLPVHLARRALQETLYRPVVLLHARPQVRGLEHLREADPPFLFVANHRSHLDGGLFMARLPFALRGRIAPAMTTRHHRAFFGEADAGLGRYLKECLQARLTQLLFHAWPLPETAGFRQSLAYAGELADAGFSILIFPEGRFVREGLIEPFRKGIGIFARDLRAPVIPAYIEGTEAVLPAGRWWPRFGRTRLALGAPIRIEADADPEEATRRIESAVRALRSGDQ
ncbi:MAG: AMP-binding protein [Acidobacteriota bacterium]